MKDMGDNFTLTVALTTNLLNMLYQFAAFNFSKTILK